jgi:hypothetical protein
MLNRALNLDGFFGMTLAMENGFTWLRIGISDRLL